jgi:hypothetical protein
MTTNLSHLIVAIDAGASVIKVLGSTEGCAEFTTLTIDPYCVVLDAPALPDPKFDEHSLWIRICGKYYAVGNIARAKIDGRMEVEALKIDTLIPKVCAAVAAMHHRLNLPGKFDLSLVSVLPPGEESYRDEFRSKLTFALKSIGTPKGVIKPIVKKISIHPEGFGVMNWHRTIGIARERSITTIMCGFRNTSVFSCTKGVFTDSKTSAYGFHSLLTAGADNSGTSPQIASFFQPTYKYLSTKDDSGFRKLCRRSEDKENEITRIKTAIDIAASEYFANLKGWLKSALSPTDVIVLCGGNADYIYDNLYEFLKDYVEEIPRVGIPVLKHIGEVHIPEGLAKTGMKERFLDVYCLWVLLSKSLGENND